MSKVNIVNVCIAGKFSHIKIFHKSKHFDILSKMAAVLEISFFLENKKCYKMFEASKKFFSFTIWQKCEEKITWGLPPRFFLFFFLSFHPIKSALS